MRLGLMLGYAGRRIELPIELVREADRLGVYAVWTAEAYGSDAVSPLAWLGALTQNIKLGTAIMQMPGRTPANAAMTAMTLNQLSHGRFLMGLGLSGPQVVEGWHGQSYAQPLARTREYVDIVRQIFGREERLVFDGRHYQIPYRGDDATGLGKPLKSTLEAAPDIPIYLAAIGPKNVELAAEVADGWLPIFFSPEKFDDIYKPHLEAGFARAGNGKSLANFDVAPTVSVVINDNMDICYNMLRPFLALYIGGMGAKGRNFYNDLAGRYGYEAEAAEIQDLYLAGKQGEAMMKVPAGLIDEVALVGPRERVKERLALWRNSPVTTMNITVFDIETLRTMVELVAELT
ncbi:MAG TPA: LLM class F420-dependent oxidoreductase [Chloroflexota bacterium]|nr:LLM class F420-dependent oxidoreductase [Chloroflexota bacterium]HUM69965.1 LLM class F420-dependent oxidoreductase [Chloroflexota bacterium]